MPVEGTNAGSDAFKRQIIRRLKMTLLGRIFGSSKEKKAPGKPSAAKKTAAGAEKSGAAGSKGSKAGTPAKKSKPKKAAAKK
jgi:hypothetical protein